MPTEPGRGRVADKKERQERMKKTRENFSPETKKIDFFPRFARFFGWHRASGYIDESMDSQTSIYDDMPSD